MFDKHKFPLSLLIIISAVLYLNMDFIKLSFIITSNVMATEWFVPRFNLRFAYTRYDKPMEYGEYDFIIVGAGSAGSVVANKLSKNRKWKILLLEAGGEDSKFSDIPGMSPYLLKSDMNWGYYTTIQKNCCQGMKGKQCSYPRGKVLGGTGTINALIYTRGSMEDYNYWAQLGNEGWSYKDVENYFIDLEDWQTYGDEGFHGRNGPLTCNRASPNSKLTSIFIEALKERGIPELDFNGKLIFGVSKTIFNINYNKRVSGNTAFLKNIRDERPNLDISEHSYASEILINPQTKKAYGVEFIKNHAKYIARARKEIILSGGSINTPQLLMLSGIGPKEELLKHDINIFKDLPVGKHMQEQALFLGLNILTNFTKKNNNFLENVLNYINGDTPFTMAFPANAIAFVKLGNDSRNVPDFEIILNTGAPYSNIVQFGTNANEKLVHELKKQALPNVFTFNFALLHAKSRGSVTLNSDYSLDYPNIDLNFYTDEKTEDIELMYKAILFLQDLLNTQAYKAINATLLPPDICLDFTKLSKPYWICVIKQMTQQSHNSVGTTRMGKNEKSSVVDSKLRIHGINNLRIIDAGVMPEIISGHSNAPTFMIASKMSDEIFKEYLNY